MDQCIIQKSVSFIGVAMGRSKPNRCDLLWWWRGGADGMFSMFCGMWWHIGGGLSRIAFSMAIAGFVGVLMEGQS